MNPLDRIHRHFIEKVNNARDLSLEYYEDIDIEPKILPLVRLLNNRWTVTAHSCCGHLKPKPMCPYVSFFIMDGKEKAWERIWGKARLDIAPHVSTKATINVTETRELPEYHKDWVSWRLMPASGQGGLKNLFKTEKEFRKTYDALIAKTCLALKKATEKERGS